MLHSLLKVQQMEMLKKNRKIKMKPSFILSAILHISAFVILYYGIPNFVSDIKTPTDFVMTAEVVTVGDFTNVVMKSSRVSEAKVTEDAKKAPKSISELQPAVPQKQEEKVVRSPEKQAEESKEIIPEAKKIKKAKEEPKKARPKPIPKESKSPKKRDDSFERSILKSLEESSKKDNEKKIEKDFSDLEKALIGDTNMEFNPELPLTMSELDAIKAQIISNWNVTSFSGAVGASDFRVIIEIDLDQQGYVLSVNPHYESNTSPYYRVFVESAIRATKLSSPLKNLNPQKYNTWKKITFEFDPSGMIY